MGVMDDRRKMIAAQPHLVTTTGATSVLIAEPRIQKMRVNLAPIQAGSGAPSGSNKRGISAFYWMNIYIGETYIRKQLSPAVFNGYYDSNTGDEYSDYTSQTTDASTSVTTYSTRGNSSFFWLYFGNVQIYNNPTVPILSNMFTFYGYTTYSADIPDWSFSGNASYPNSLWVKLPTSVLPESSLNGAKQWVANNPVQIVGPRKDGAIETNIGAIDIDVARGLQTVTPSYDSMTIDLTYWTH